MSLPASFLDDVKRLIPADRRFDDPLSTLAFGTDASFYRLIPKLVIRVESEDEVVTLLKLAQVDRVPVTFRAAGTSLSGQAISDSVLIVLGDNWNGREVRREGEQIRLQPGVIGAQAGTAIGARMRAEQLRLLLAALVLLVCGKLGLDLLIQPAELYSLSAGGAG